MIKLLCLLLACTQLAAALPSKKVRYDGHKVLEIHHTSEDKLDKLIELGHQFEVDWWNLPRHSNDSLHLRVHPDQLEDFTSEIKKIGAHILVFIDDVQKLIDQEPSLGHHQRTKRATSRRSGYNVQTVYHNLHSIHNYLNHFASATTLRKGVTATMMTIGHTYEGRPQEMLLISSPNGLASKKSILIDGGIHAREWIAPAVVLYFIEQLAYNPSDDPIVTKMLEHFDFYMLPVVNPDGYEYTNTERLWRKNRHKSSTSSCYGVDVNRNFPFHWNPETGGSKNPCSELYSGPAAASEQETQNLMKFLQVSRTNPIVAYLTIHSYGQLWLYPWGYTSALPKDYRELDAVAWFTTKNLEKLHETRYDIGSAKRTLYAAAGGSDDYAKGSAEVKYSYTVELRDSGRYGFLLPSCQIQPTNEETFEGLKAFVTALIAHEGW